MSGGRPGKGLAHVEDVEGSEYAKERLRVILQVLDGTLTRKDGARVLGISERRFRQIRDAALSGALLSLEPGSPGRPRKQEPVEALSTQAIREAHQWLERQLTIAELREEIALVMPELYCGDRLPETEGPSRRGVAGRRRISRGLRRG